MWIHILTYEGMTEQVEMCWEVLLSSENEGNLVLWEYKSIFSFYLVFYWVPLSSRTTGSIPPL